MSALVRWLPELAVATADDIAQYGPNAARVRTLLDFLPTMSDEASDLTANVYNAARAESWSSPRSQARHRAGLALWNSGLPADIRAAMNAANDDARRVARRPVSDAEWEASLGPVVDAVDTEVASNLISPEDYRVLTNPLATGRAVDVLARRYKNTPFRGLIQELAPKSLITQPEDVLRIGRIARSPEDIREIAMTLIRDGVPIDEAYQMARLV